MNVYSCTYDAVNLLLALVINLLYALKLALSPGDTT